MLAVAMRRGPITILVHIALAAMFGWFAWLQRNDIDPAIYDHPSVLDAALWLLFYALISVLLLVVLFRPVPWWLLLFSALACAAELATTGPGLYENLCGNKPFTMTQASMSATDPRVELSREFFGALIALLGVGVATRQSRRLRYS